MFKTPDGTSLALSLSLSYLSTLRDEPLRTSNNARASVKAPGFFCAGAL